MIHKNESLYAHINVTMQLNHLGCHLCEMILYSALAAYNASVRRSGHENQQNQQKVCT